MKGIVTTLLILGFFSLSGCNTASVNANERHRTTSIDQADMFRAAEQSDVVALQEGVDGGWIIRQSTIRRTPTSFIARGFSTFNGNTQRTTYYDVEIDCLGERMTDHTGEWIEIAGHKHDSVGRLIVSKICQPMPFGFEFSEQVQNLDYYQNFSSVKRTKTSENSFEFQMYRGPWGLQDFEKPFYLWREIDCIGRRARETAQTLAEAHGGYEEPWVNMLETVADPYNRYNFYCGNTITSQLLAGYLQSDKKKNEMIDTKSQDIQFDDAKTTCVDLGFKDGTEAFGECVLKLTE